MTKNNKEEKMVEIEELYKFGVNDIARVNLCQAPDLFLVKGNFLKHSIISKHNLAKTGKEEMYAVSNKPFYRANIILDNFDQTDRFKEALQTLSYLEPIFKARINKYGEYEIFCEGKVHYEKICQDLADDGFLFTLCEQKINFHETCGGHVDYKKDEIHIVVNQNEKIPDTYTAKNGTNTLLCINKTYEGFARNAFELIIKYGPLIGEQIEFTHFIVDITNSAKFNDAFGNIKKHLILAYELSSPKIIPLYIICKIQISINYVGIVYNLLHKYNYVLENEEYNDLLEFFEITVYLPQFQYYDFVENLRMKTKGTCYVEYEEFGYFLCEKHSFVEYIDEFRKRQGMFNEEVLVAEPEKQRTLKK